MKVNANNLQHRDGRGRDGLREGSPLQSQIGPSLEYQPRLRQTSLLSACNSQRRKVCRAAAYARAGHVTARHFCDWLGRSARGSQGRLAMPLSQRLRMCATTKKGAREAGRSERSSAHSRILTDPTTRRRCSKGSLPSQRARGHGRRGHRRRKSWLWFCEAFMCHMWVFSCGEAEPGDPLGGAMQCGGGGGAKRRTMRAQQVRECWEGEGRRRETVGGGSCFFIELSSGGRPVHAPSPIRRAPNPRCRTPRPRL